MSEQKLKPFHIRDDIIRQIGKLVEQGLNDDEIITKFVTEFGDDLGGAFANEDELREYIQTHRRIYERHKHDLVPR